MKKAEKLIKFFSNEARLNEIKVLAIRRIVKDIVKKSENNGYSVTASQYQTLVKAKVWIYRHRKSMGVHGKPAKVKVYTKEEINQYQKGL